MKTLVLLIISVMSTAFVLNPDFLTEQKKYQRVKTAYSEKEKTVLNCLKEANIDINSLNILITAYKAEQELIIYAKNKTEKTYKKLITYPICASSGVLGPKRQQGDGQVPEGFYYIDRYNPSSSYYLSLGLNYPNKSDQLKSPAKHLGGDIFIHGECVTIGCMPMTNDKIKEIYLYALQAKQSGQQKIPVYVFPFKFTEANKSKYTKQYGGSQPLLDFWNNLNVGYDKFQSSLQELNVTVDKKGSYQF